MQTDIFTQWLAEVSNQVNIPDFTPELTNDFARRLTESGYNLEIEDTNKIALLQGRSHATSAIGSCFTEGSPIKSKEVFLELATDLTRNYKLSPDGLIELACDFFGVAIWGSSVQGGLIYKRLVSRLWISMKRSVPVEKQPWVDQFFRGCLLIENLKPFPLGEGNLLASSFMTVICEGAS